MLQVEHIAVLPHSENFPWRLRLYDGILVFYNEDFGTYTLDGTKLVKVILPTK